LDRIYREQGKLEKGDIQIVKYFGSSSRVEGLENEVKDQLRKDIRKFELAARNGERISRYTSGTFR